MHNNGTFQYEAFRADAPEKYKWELLFWPIALFIKQWPKKQRKFFNLFPLTSYRPIYLFILLWKITPEIYNIIHRIQVQNYKWKYHIYIYIYIYIYILFGCLSHNHAFHLNLIIGIFCVFDKTLTNYFRNIFTLNIYLCSSQLLPKLETNYKLFSL